MCKNRKYIYFYFQGIPLGLIASIPMLLVKSEASYKEQAKFSFAYWPFSLKLLWAPIVDSIYSERLGRRKTWLVPMQYLLGIFMFCLSFKIDGMLDHGDITQITLVFFCLNFLAATQDIAVDGWALTMLKRYFISLLFTRKLYIQFLEKMWDTLRPVIALGKLLDTFWATSFSLHWNLQTFVTII
jgi:hypothetical protein